MVGQARDADFSTFARDSHAPLLRVAHLLCGGDQPAAEDLLQTALLKTYLNWRRIRDRTKARAYVRTTMARTLVSGRRRSWTREVTDDPVPDRADDTDAYEQLDTRLDLLSELNELPPRQRIAVVLRHYLGLSEADTAAELSCSVAAVKNLTARGLRALRAQETQACQHEGDDNGSVRGAAPEAR